MLTIEHLNPSQRLGVGIALTFAAEVLPTFEKQCPKDLRPRNALITVMKWLNGEATAEECRAAAYVASAAANAAYAAYAAYAVDAAANTAYAASVAANTAYVVYVASVAYVAAVAAVADALNKNEEEHIHDTLLQLLPLILQFKIDNHEKFNNAEEVFEYLNDEDRAKFLFNLDVLI